jgi:hypothetical protein
MESSRTDEAMHGIWTGPLGIWAAAGGRETTEAIVACSRGCCR